jgi:hypothetical protein
MIATGGDGGRGCELLHLHWGQPACGRAIAQPAGVVVSPAPHGVVGQERAAVDSTCGDGGHAGQWFPAALGENLHGAGRIYGGPVP